MSGLAVPRVRLRCAGMCPVCSSDLRAWKPWRPASDCRTAKCQIQRAQQKQTIAEQSSTIEALQGRLNRRLADEIVPFKAEVEQQQTRADILTKNLAEMQSRRNAEQKSRRALEAASIEQTQTIARLTEEIASLNMLLQERAREARLIHELAEVEAKRHARAERRWADPAQQIAQLKARAEEQLAAAEEELKSAPVRVLVLSKPDF